MTAIQQDDAIRSASPRPKAGSRSKRYSPPGTGRITSDMHSSLPFVAFFLALPSFASIGAYSKAGSQEQRPEWKEFYAKQQGFQQKGTDALNLEKELEKRDECKNALSTLDFGECISREFGQTQQNYLAYVRAIGGLVRLNPPGEATPGGGNEPDAGKALDSAEALWIRYRDAECESVGNQYWGGSMRPGAIMECRVKLTQYHIRDLAEFYGDLWN